MNGGGKRVVPRGSARTRLVNFQTHKLAAARRAASDHTESMLARAETLTGTRRRVLPLVGSGFATLGVLFSLVFQNVMAVNFTTSDKELSVFSNYLDAQQAAAFLAPSTRKNADAAGQHGVADLGIKTAKLAGFCAIAQESILGLNVYSLIITAGQDVPNATAFNGTSVPTGVTTSPTTGELTGTSLTNAISAQNLYLNSRSINGFGNLISGLNLGQSADTVAASADLAFPAGTATPVPGNFGLYAKQLNVAGLNGKSYGLNLAGNITLPKLNIRVAPGGLGQDDCSSS